MSCSRNSFAASGNTPENGTGGVVSPARIPGVLAVGGLDQQANLWFGSEPGPEVALAAPGVDIIAPAPLDKPDNPNAERLRQLERRHRNELEETRTLRLEEFRFGHGTFYLHFPDKRACFLGFVEDARAELDAYVQTRLPREASLGADSFCRFGVRMKGRPR